MATNERVEREQYQGQATVTGLPLFKFNSAEREAGVKSRYLSLERLHVVSEVARRSHDRFEDEGSRMVSNLRQTSKKLKISTLTCRVQDCVE